MKRTKIVAGNWKMNLDVKDSQNLAQEISEKVAYMELSGIRIMIAPTFTNLYPVYHHTRLDRKVEIIAQNMHQAKNGAYTGEISAEMLKSIGINTVILGHSERRQYFNETDAALAEKMLTVLNNEMEVVFCFGEVLEDRKAGKHFEVVESQLKNALFHLSANDFKSIILAYEPVWAIGTGETATPLQAQEMHAFVRKVLTEKYGMETAQEVSILYGGSVKPDNATEIFMQPDVDGGLIGGAALKADDFVKIVEAI
jgi:triosephosphate isomerase